MKFKMVYENYNVQDLSKSLDFYRKALGLTEKRRKTAPDGSFIIVYVGNEDSDFELELTWLAEHPQKYDRSEEEFHLAFHVDDFDAAHKLHQEIGCICFENPSMGIYIIQDPDGYWLEIIPIKHNDTLTDEDKKAVEGIYHKMIEEGADKFDFLIALYNQALTLEDPLRIRTLTDTCLELIGSSLEKILKALLLPIDWKLVFEERKDSKPSIERMINGNFYSIGGEKAFRLLKKESSLKLPSSLRKLLFRHNTYRNQQKHFTHTNPKLAIQSTIVEAMSGFIVLRNALQSEESIYNLSARELSIFDHIIEELSKLQEVYKKNLEIAKQKAMGKKVDWNTLKVCPVCRQKFLELGQGRISTEMDSCHCYFCDYSATSEEAAELYAENILGETETMFDVFDSGESYIKLCEFCGEHTVVTYHEEGTEPRYVCFNCGREWNIKNYVQCDDCGVWYYEDDQIVNARENSYHENIPYLCKNCRANWSNRFGGD